MALNRLYPPILAGTIPSFYTTNTGTSLEVPFSMNVTVSGSAVTGMRLRLKTTSTDVVIANVISTEYGTDAVNRSVIYRLDDTIVKKLVVGNFYKVQLAYVDTNGNDGYYSTVAIVKYTAEPSVGIAKLNMQSLTAISSNSLIGTYSNADESEKVYQYRFVFSSLTGDTLQDTGWLIHNVQSNSALDESTDECLIAFNLTEGETYRVRYSIITNNGLTVHSVNYEIVKTTVTIGSVDINIQAQADNENARVIVRVYPNRSWLIAHETDEYLLKGQFLICRRESNNARNLWESLAELDLNIALREDKPYEFVDYAIESGGQYQYSIQKFNSQRIYSTRITTGVSVTPYFEDAYLYDGQRQLRIKYNPTVTSFKTVLAETKKTTLGRQYPFILRNGVLNYKEFPIGGLISYLMDNDELFMSKTELNRNWGWREIDGQTYYRDFASTDLTDENFVYERKFKLAVLDWLTDGGIKLFKSPQEGSYIVRLTNVNLSPNTTVSRMLHSFTCTASQVADFSLTALSNYSLLTTQTEVVYTDTEETIELSNFMSNSSATGSRDLTGGVGCRKVKFTWYNPSSQGNNSTPPSSVYGMNFSWGEYNFSIGKSGVYEIELDNYSTSPLIYTNPPNNYGNIVGYVTLTLEAQETDNLDAVREMLSQTMYGYGAYGLNEPMSTVTFDTTTPKRNDVGEIEKDKNGNIIYIQDKGQFSRNLLEDWNGLKSDLSQVVWIEYYNIPVYDCGLNTIQYVWNNILTEGGAIPAALQYSDQILLKQNNTYWRYVPKAEHLIFDSSLGKYPEVTKDDFVKIDNYGTEIVFGSKRVDINEPYSGEDGTNVDFLKTELPLDVHGELNLRIQNGVQVYIYGRVETRTYALEENYGAVENYTQIELDAYEDYLMKLFNFTQVEDTNNITANFVYVFDNRQFVEINKRQIAEYVKAGKKIYVAYYPHVYSDDAISRARKDWQIYRKNLNNYLTIQLNKKEVIK